MTDAQIGFWILVGYIALRVLAGMFLREETTFIRGRRLLSNKEAKQAAERLWRNR